MNILDIFIFSVNAILPMILLIFLGYSLKVKGLISKEFVANGNKVVFKVCLPVLLFLNISEIEDFSEIKISSVIYVIIIISVLIFLGFITSLFVKDKKQKGVMMQCVFRSNFALIGVPLSELIAGSDGVVCAAVLSVFTIPIYNIVAVIVLTAFTGEKKKGAVLNQLKAIAKNPLIIGVILGFIAMIIKNSLPGGLVQTLSVNFEFVPKFLGYISKMATPLALLVLGGQFEFSSVKGYRKMIVSATVLRTIVAPGIGIGVAAFLTKSGIVMFEPALFATFIALFGTPVAVSSAIMAEAMDNDGQLAAQLVVWTSVVSMFTLFVFVFLCRMLGLV